MVHNSPLQHTTTPQIQAEIRLDNEVLATTLVPSTMLFDDDTEIRACVLNSIDSHRRLSIWMLIRERHEVIICLTTIDGRDLRRCFLPCFA
ncbi:MAG TPA: hypothetical protein PLW14_03035 [Chlorobiota bacterium]|nr:hypothetical protein [Chlorobiota bacterium]